MWLVNMSRRTRAASQRRQVLLCDTNVGTHQASKEEGGGFLAKSKCRQRTAFQGTKDDSGSVSKGSEVCRQRQGRREGCRRSRHRQDPKAINQRQGNPHGPAQEASEPEEVEAGGNNCQASDESCTQADHLKKIQQQHSEKAKR